MKRPSQKELYKKIEEARKVLECQLGLFANQSKVVGELNALEIETHEIWPLIKCLLEEIRPEDYAGTHPPQESYERTINGLSCLHLVG